VKELFFVLATNLLLFPGARAQTPASQATTPKPLTIEQIFAEGGVAGRAPETIKWSPDGTRISFVQRDDDGEHGQLCYADALTGEKGILVSESKLSQLAPPVGKLHDEREIERLTRYHVAAYDWSPDSKHLLFDSHGQLWYYSLDTGTAVSLTSSPDASTDPKFSPDGKQLAYVRKHNLYVHPVAGEGGERLLTREEKEKNRDRESDKEKENNILNGEVDWVYAEELAVRSNYFWSPEGHEILFLQMDETRIPTYPITDWLPTHPRVEQEKYPQPGDSNPSVRLGVVNSNGGKARWIRLTDDDNDNDDIYIPRFGWIREGWAWAEVLNRKQDVMDLYFIDAKSGKSRKLLTETAPGAWVNVNDDFRILKSGDRFLWTSWRDGHTHIYLYSFNAPNPLASDARLERQLESGDYEVIAVNAVDEASGTIFFTANKGDPRQEKVFSVKLDASAVQSISPEEGNYTASFADDGKHYVETHSATLTPPRILLCVPGGNCYRIWESRSVADYHLIAPEALEFKADDGTPLYGYLILPRDADEQNGSIPLIVHIYGGPAGQTVQNAWGGSGGNESTALFHQILANEGFAIFSVDNRGTPNRGKKFSAAIRLQFGGVELKDQLAALDQLYPQFPQLDRNRTGIWGWSNGGSMTLYALTHSDRFKAGISIAPVTNWRDYDSTYTERYMGLLKDNPNGYDDSMVRAAYNLHGSLLLAHGTSDDNVHFQNTIQMTDALIKAGKQFRLMMYPDKTHGIAGAGTRAQLFHMMEDFWNQELK